MGPGISAGSLMNRIIDEGGDGAFHVLHPSGEELKEDTPCICTASSSNVP